VAGCLDLAAAEAGVGAVAKADQKNTFFLCYLLLFAATSNSRSGPVYQLFALPFNYINLWMVIYDPKPSK
jgi:hypothetical protein